LATGPPFEKEQIAAMKSVIPAFAVADIAASIRWYNDVLGFETSLTMPDESGQLMHGSIKRGDVEIMFGRIDPNNPHDQGPLGQGMCLYTTVGEDEDVDALYERAKQAGGKILQEPADQFWGHRDWAVADPDGYITVVSKVITKVTEEQVREAMLAGSPAD
jgi:uncharacterized glyoxalase superfamily protein PhnB